MSPATGAAAALPDVTRFPLAFALLAFALLFPGVPAAIWTGQPDQHFALAVVAADADTALLVSATLAGDVTQQTYSVTFEDGDTEPVVIRLSDGAIEDVRTRTHWLWRTWPREDLTVSATPAGEQVTVWFLEEWHVASCTGSLVDAFFGTAWPLILGGIGLFMGCLVLFVSTVHAQHARRRVRR